jgi:hypothetical protein
MMGLQIRPRHHWHNTDSGPELVRVELGEDMAPGTAANAFLVAYAPADSTGIPSDPGNFVTTDQSIQIFDPFAKLSGSSGERFWAVYRRDDEAFEIFSGRCCGPQTCWGWSYAYARITDYPGTTPNLCMCYGNAVVGKTYPITESMISGGHLMRIDGQTIRAALNKNYPLTFSTTDQLAVGSSSAAWSGTSNLLKLRGGTLSTRSGDFAGVLSVSDTSGISPGDAVPVYWESSDKLTSYLQTITVSAITPSTSITFATGSGDILPDVDTAIGFVPAGTSPASVSNSITLSFTTDSGPPQFFKCVATVSFLDDGLGGGPLWTNTYQFNNVVCGDPAVLLDWTDVASNSSGAAFTATSETSVDLLATMKDHQFLYTDADLAGKWRRAHCASDGVVFVGDGLLTTSDPAKITYNAAEDSTWNLDEYGDPQGMPVPYYQTHNLTWGFGGSEQTATLYFGGTSSLYCAAGGNSMAWELFGKSPHTDTCGIDPDWGNNVPVIADNTVATTWWDNREIYSAEASVGYIQAQAGPTYDAVYAICSIAPYVNHCNLPAVQLQVEGQTPTANTFYITCGGATNDNPVQVFSWVANACAAPRWWLYPAGGNDFLYWWIPSGIRDFWYDVDPLWPIPPAQANIDTGVPQYVHAKFGYAIGPGAPRYNAIDFFNGAFDATEIGDTTLTDPFALVQDLDQPCKYAYFPGEPSFTEADYAIYGPIFTIDQLQFGTLVWTTGYEGVLTADDTSNLPAVNEILDIYYGYYDSTDTSIVQEAHAATVTAVDSITGAITVSLDPGDTPFGAVGYSYGGSPGSMPVAWDSQANTVTTTFSIWLTIPPFLDPPTVVGVFGDPTNPNAFAGAYYFVPSGDEVVTGYDGRINCVITLDSYLLGEVYDLDGDADWDLDTIDSPGGAGYLDGLAEFSQAGALMYLPRDTASNQIIFTNSFVGDYLMCTNCTETLVVEPDSAPLGDPALGINAAPETPAGTLTPECGPPNWCAVIEGIVGEQMLVDVPWGDQPLNIPDSICPGGTTNCNCSVLSGTYECINANADPPSDCAWGGAYNDPWNADEWESLNGVCESTCPPGDPQPQDGFWLAYVSLGSLATDPDDGEYTAGILVNLTGGITGDMYPGAGDEISAYCLHTFAPYFVSFRHLGYTKDSRQIRWTAISATLQNLISTVYDTVSFRYDCPCPHGAGEGTGPTGCCYPATISVSAGSERLFS